MHRLANFGVSIAIIACTALVVRAGEVVGAIIFADFYLVPKLRLRSDFAEFVGDRFNWAAGLTWLATLVNCCALVAYFGKEKIFFVGLPGWFVAAGLYIALSHLYQRRNRA